MIKLKIIRDTLDLSDKVEGFFRKKVTSFGTGAKVDCPKEYLGRTVYLVVCKHEQNRRIRKRKSGTKKRK